jgi:hypothetical protein
LRAEVVVSDISIKPIRIDPMAVRIVTETRVSNQHGALVTRGSNAVLVHRSADQAAAAREP